MDGHLILLYLGTIERTIFCKQLSESTSANCRNDGVHVGVGQHCHHHRVVIQVVVVIVVVVIIIVVVVVVGRIDDVYQ